MPKRVKYEVELKSSTVTIAIAQIKGPLPDGKHRTLVGERDSLAWKSLEDVTARIEKACGIIDAVNRKPSKPDIIVFPEYSIPVERALPRLQKLANEYKQIIIAGGDSIQLPQTRKIYNQCPIIIPGRRAPIWVIKRKLSQWEQGLIDEPAQASLPILTWEVEGRSYWLAVYTCLDYMLAPRETKEGGGIFIVSMCSPEVHPFRSWADEALRIEGGTATVLCNCIGGEMTGQSGVIAVVPGAKPLKPAFELPDSEEAVAVFEINCKQLDPRKKTSLSFKSSLGKRHFYSLLPTSGRIELSRLIVGDNEVITRAVVNPAIFGHLGKKMRMAFLSVDNFWEVVNKLKDQDYEVLAILGQHDLLITHLHAERYDMIYDIRQVVSWKSSVSDNNRFIDEISDDDYNNFPFFRADVYFKVLGVRVDHESDPAHNKTGQLVPSIQERVQILKLGNDWNDGEVPDEARERFKKSGWIIGTTELKPGEINFIMTIFLNHTGPQLQERQEAFEIRVMPELIKKKVVTSIYRGRSQQLAIHYVLRVWADLNSFYALVEDVYKLASEARVTITTTTYVVLKRLSDLSLEKAVLAPMLTGEETQYRNKVLALRLSKEDRASLVYLPPEKQRNLIKAFQYVREAMNCLEGSDWFVKHIDEIERKVATGLLHDDYSILREPHDIFQVRVETILRQFIKDEISDAQLEGWKPALSIQSGKKKDNLSFTERIKVVARCLQERGEVADLTDALRNLPQTITVRNAMAHTDWDRLTVETYTDAIKVYCKFITRWEQ